MLVESVEELAHAIHAPLPAHVLQHRNAIFQFAYCTAVRASREVPLYPGIENKSIARRAEAKEPVGRVAQDRAPRRGDEPSLDITT